MGESKLMSLNVRSAVEHASNMSSRLHQSKTYPKKIGAVQSKHAVPQQHH
jgi:hypothetical protein